DRHDSGAAGQAVRGVHSGRCHDCTAFRGHGTRPCPLAQARAHDGRRCDRDERAGQRLSVHGAPARKRRRLTNDVQNAAETSANWAPRVRPLMARGDIWLRPTAWGAIGGEAAMPRAWGPHRCDAHDPDPKWAGRFCRDARAPTCYTSSVLLGPGEVHEAAGIHRTYRQRCSRVATCSARAAGGEPTIGYLGATTPSAESQRVAALVQRLRAFGWIESRNLTIEYRYAEGRSERYAELAAEFVRLNVDVIITYGTP